MSDALSPIETVMWRVGHDPTLRMTVGNLMLLDRAPDASGADRTPGRGIGAGRATPPATGRADLRPAATPVDDGPRFRPGPPRARLTVPPPGDLRQLLDVVALLEPVPFEPDHSPWDATIIDGLAGGKAAVYLRAHHVLTDGFGGTSILSLLFDETRRPAPGSTGSHRGPRRDRASQRRSAAGYGHHRPQPGHAPAGVRNGRHPQRRTRQACWSAASSEAWMSPTRCHARCSFPAGPSVRGRACAP